MVDAKTARPTNLGGQETADWRVANATAMVVLDWAVQSAQAAIIPDAASPRGQLFSAGDGDDTRPALCGLANRTMLPLHPGQSCWAGHSERLPISTGTGRDGCRFSSCK